MKKVVFIIPYFGKFNNYFNLFLKSCENNPTINWLIFTDDERKFNYPKNVRVIYTTFEDIKKKFQKKFDFELCLNKPYKLCDYKVTYGYIFNDYIKDFDYWGYCDTDLIFGNIRKFLDKSINYNFDKIGFFGHCTLFKNNKLVNEMFMSELKGEKIYKKVFSSDEGFAFDEEFHDSINDIFLSNNMTCDFVERQANIYRKSSNFKLTKYDFISKKYNIEKKRKAFFVYNNGALFRYYLNNCKCEEFMYIHMQARPMKINTSNLNCFKIIPNSFDYFNLDELNNINKVKIKHFNLHYFKHRSKNLILKIRKVIKK